MILEVPNSKNGSKLISDIIKSSGFKSNNPVYYPFSQGIILLFDHKEVDARSENLQSKIAIANYVNLNEKNMPANYVILYKTGSKLGVIAKKKSETTLEEKFDFSIQSLVRLFENYKDLALFYLKDDDLTKLIAQLKSVYSEENCSFTEIEKSISEDHYSRFVKKSKSFNFSSIKDYIDKRKEAAEAKKRKKDKEIKDNPPEVKTGISKGRRDLIIAGGAIALALAGGAYYFKDVFMKEEPKVKKKPKKKPKIAKDTRKEIPDRFKNSRFRVVNRNVNTYSKIKELIKDDNNIELLTINRDSIEAIVKNNKNNSFDEIIYKFGDKLIGKINIKNTGKIESNEDVIQEDIESLIKKYVGNNYTYIKGEFLISSTMTKKELLSFLKKVSFSNELIFEGTADFNGSLANIFMQLKRG